MVETIACPQCGRKLEMSPAYLGQLVQCPQCAHTFTAAPMASAAPPIASSPPRVAASRSARTFDEEPRDIIMRGPKAPHRGSLIKTLGLLGLVGGFLFLVPLFLGPLAWFWGRRDLEAMAQGRMDARGEADTRLGHYCGIGASLLLLVYGGLCCCMMASH